MNFGRKEYNARTYLTSGGLTETNKIYNYSLSSFFFAISFYSQASVSFSYFVIDFILSLVKNLPKYFISSSMNYCKSTFEV